jgi:hypothetical protein
MKLSIKKSTGVLLMYVAVLLVVCLLAVFGGIRTEGFRSYARVDPTVPENQVCSTLVKRMFPNYQFSDKAKNIIGTLKPDMTSSFGAIGIEPNMNFQCVIPNYPSNPQSLVIAGGGGAQSFDTSTDLKMFNIDVQRRYNGDVRCSGRMRDGTEKINLPFRNEETSLKGCTLSIANYKDNPEQ